MSTRKPTKGLTPAQCIAAAHIARGDTDSVAAEAAGVALSTVKSWRHQKPAFLEEINALVIEGQRLIMRRKLALQDKGIRELEKLLDAPDSGPGSITPTQRAAAIKIALDHSPMNPAIAVEPQPEAPRQLPPAQRFDPEGNPVVDRPVEETLLEMYREMAKIEEARARQRQPLVIDSADDEDDDNDHEDEPRVILGEVVEDDNDTSEEPDATPRQINHRPKVRKIEGDEAMLRRIARERGGSGGGLGGSRIVG